MNAKVEKKKSKNNKKITDFFIMKHLQPGNRKYLIQIQRYLQL